MNLGATPLCPECGARLRRGREAGTRCDPCQRAGPRLVLPPGFYDQPPLLGALEVLDFGRVFLAIRAHTHWSQESLGEYLGFEQCRISAIENGKRSLHDLSTAITVANRLAIPAGKLGFAHGVTVGGGTSTGRKGSWVDRRNFVEHVGALTVGVTGVAGLDIDRLTALLPQSEPTGTRHVGAADVEAIEQATTAFVRRDFAQGSGMVRDAAVTQLRVTLPLLSAQTGPEVRPRLLLATAHLALMAGYTSFDVNQHDAARRLWMIGLNIARAADHPRGSDLTGYLLYDMALQAVQLGRPKEALRLVYLGHTVATGSPTVSASTVSCLASIQARAHAAQGDAAGCDRALGHALERFSAIDQASTPPWGSHAGEAGMSGYQGSAHYTLAMAGGDPRAAGQAVVLLRRAVDGFGSGYAKLRGLYLPDLAGAHAIAGDTDTAVAVGHQAIGAVTALHSPRVYDRLRVLNTALEPLHTSAGVAELRERLHTIAA
ncbi:MAG: helix-turn-helix domain-containing protein, partial [Pseudonocardiaceae bacterium]